MKEDEKWNYCSYHEEDDQTSPPATWLSPQPE